MRAIAGRVLGWGLVLAAGATAHEATTRWVDVPDGYGRWGRALENPRAETRVRRATRVFKEVLRPTQRFFAPWSPGVTYFPNMDRWEDRGPGTTGPRVIPNTPNLRTLWLRWDLWKVPRGAVVTRAELRMAMKMSDIPVERVTPSRVGLALQTVTPGRVTTRWNRNLRLPVADVHHNYPSMWWDVSRFAQVAHQVGDLHRPIGLAVDNAGHLTDRRPELHVWYRLPVDATAE